MNTTVLFFFSMFSLNQIKWASGSIFFGIVFSSCATRETTPVVHVLPNSSGVVVNADTLQTWRRIFLAKDPAKKFLEEDYVI